MSKPYRSNLAILGSTGSIGTQTLDVVRKTPERFNVLSLAAGRNIELLLEQIKEFNPNLVAVADKEDAERLRGLVSEECKVLSGEQGVVEAACFDGVHTVVAALVGFLGLRSVLEAIHAGKHIALANKETMVAGGELVKEALAQSSSRIVPVDSEHNSLFQCLNGRYCAAQLRKVIITASGGPFLHSSVDELANVTAEQALAHPRWNMGAKISIDSATMMNKCLEVIEAAMLFDISPEQIEVLVHPQSLVHGLVEFEDGACIAAISNTDMRLPIAHAIGFLNSPHPVLQPGARIVDAVRPLNLAEVGKLEFLAVDNQKFPSINMAFDVLKTGGNRAIVLNSSNEVAVEQFLSGQIRFNAITQVVAQTLEDFTDNSQPKSFEQVVDVDSQARELARSISSRLAA